jgi:hypothetical protein
VGQGEVGWQYLLAPQNHFYSSASTLYKQQQNQKQQHRGRWMQAHSRSSSVLWAGRWVMWEGV